jgi:acyl carrier protein
MTEKNLILEAIFESIDDINETLPRSNKISKDPEALLYAPQGTLDSLTLTLLIVAVEQKIEQKLHASISLIDQTTASEDNAFHNIKTLQSHIEELIGP